MKRKTKILSIMLALLLMIGLVPSTLMHAFATEETENSYYDDYSTDDEPGYELDYNVISIEILKGPDCTEYAKGTYDDWVLFEGLEVRFTAKVGTTYDVTIEDRTDLWQSIGGGEGDALWIIEYLKDLPLGENTITYCFGGCKTTQTITVYEPDYNVTSIEILKGPDCPEYTKGTGDDWVLFEGLEVRFTAKDGTTYDVTIDEEADLWQSIGGGEEDNFRILGGLRGLEDLPLGENTITYYFGGCETTQTITVYEDPFVLNPIVGIELTKNPNKTFTEPIFDYCSTSEDYNKLDLSKINTENSIATNMEGAEIALIRQDGTVINYTFGKPFGLTEYIGLYSFDYSTYGNIWVRDAGDYKIVMGLGIEGTAETEVSIKDTPSDSSSTQPTTTVTDGTDKTDTNESKPATVDTPQGTSTNNSNGAVSTGMTVSMLIVMVLMTSGVALVWFNKKSKA